MRMVIVALEWRCAGPRKKMRRGNNYVGNLPIRDQGKWEGATELSARRLRPSVRRVSPMPSGYAAVCDLFHPICSAQRSAASRIPPSIISLSRK